MCSVECEDCSEKCEVRNGASNVTCETRHQFRRVHARTGLAATAQASSIDEKGLIYIFKATSAPPRAGTTGYHHHHHHYYYIYICYYIYCSIYIFLH